MQSKQTIEDKQEDEGDGPENAKGTTVFVKNLNFNTSEDALQKVVLFVLYISNCGLMSQKYQKFFCVCVFHFLGILQVGSSS